MDELRDGERLAAEAGDEALVVREVLGEDLHGDRALQDRVRGAEDARHAARSEAVLDPVAIGDQLALGAARAHSPPGPIPPDAAGGGASAWSESGWSSSAWVWVRVVVVGCVFVVVVDSVVVVGVLGGGL